eukprot:94979-Alexandrium_andersonii.AAC.1
MGGPRRARVAVRLMHRPLSLRPGSGGSEMSGSEIRGRSRNFGPGRGGSEMNGSGIRGRFRNVCSAEAVQK